MINGAHSIIYSAQPEADRAFLRDVLGLPHVDVGHGWLIFALPPAEVAVHPSDTNGRHELYLMTENLEVFVAAMGARGIGCTPPQDQGWGVVTSVTLPGGGTIGVYESRHARPEWRARGCASSNTSGARVGRASDDLPSPVQRLVLSIQARSGRTHSGIGW